MTITRTRALLRAKYGWSRKSVIFNRSGFHKPSGYRTNAPGYVSMVWDIPLYVRHNVGGLSTVTLLTDGWVKEIEIRELKPGDAIGYLGTDSIDTDGGFIVIFEKWLDDNPDLSHAVTWEFHSGVSPGPDQRARAVDFKWHAYRFRDITDN